MSDHLDYIGSVGIIGAGWLGLPLSLTLQEKGVKVVASATNLDSEDKLKQRGLNTCRLNLPDIDNTCSLLQCQHLVICIPPGIRYGKSDYVAKISAIVDQVELEQCAVQSITLLSSTAVYNGLFGEVTEDSVLNLQGAKVDIMHQAEQAILTSKCTNKAVLRLGGLMGYDRQPGRFFNNGKVIPNPESVINFIHRDDVIGIICQLLVSFQNNVSLKNPTNIFNCVAPHHPTRRNFYQKALSSLGMPMASFSDQEESDGKLVNSKFIGYLQYQFKYADIMACLESSS
ncbi:hypothetical protein RGQ13_16845 [Thalassotalea psychrophila]|uniref:NAD(P)-dependent oxidoreductase n=1 Tax=Thalassotalea psychrophila TaxID=3065647 RepID=A0ABY9TSI7_9GAMM|nr:hypothetical protein RGQ13_16845 [Colwelliaceae bacterium SQ149]